jgi:hypothetical protein
MFDLPLDNEQRMSCFNRFDDELHSFPRARILASLRTLASVTAHNHIGESHYDAQGSRHGASRWTATPETRPTPAAITFHNVALYTP